MSKGHVELTREKLIALANEAGSNPVRLDFTLREFHGYLFIRYGIIDAAGVKQLAEDMARTEKEKLAASELEPVDMFRIKVMKSESLNSVDPSPFLAVYRSSSCVCSLRLACV